MTLLFAYILRKSWKVIGSFCLVLEQVQPSIDYRIQKSPLHKAAILTQKRVSFVLPALSFKAYQFRYHRVTELHLSDRVQLLYRIDTYLQYLNPLQKFWYVLLGLYQASCFIKRPGLNFSNKSLLNNQVHLRKNLIYCFISGLPRPIFGLY